MPRHEFAKPEFVDARVEGWRRARTNKYVRILCSISVLATVVMFAFGYVSENIFLGIEYGLHAIGVAVLCFAIFIIREITIVRQHFFERLAELNGYCDREVYLVN